MRGEIRTTVTAAQASLLLPFIAAVIAIAGYRRTRRLLGLPTSATVRPARNGALPENLRAVSRGVMGVARISPLPSKCLARAVVLEFLARRAGYDVDVVIGVAPPSGGALPAHAWVEYHGTPVNDSVDVRSRFSPLQ